MEIFTFYWNQNTNTEAELTGRNIKTANLKSLVNMANLTAIYDKEKSVFLK